MATTEQLHLDLPRLREDLGPRPQPDFVRGDEREKCM